MTCTACKLAETRPHCGTNHPTCTWVQCPQCAATIDIRTGRGNRDGKPLTA